VIDLSIALALLMIGAYGLALHFRLLFLWKKAHRPPRPWWTAWAPALYGLMIGFGGGQLVLGIWRLT